MRGSHEGATKKPVMKISHKGTETRRISNTKYYLVSFVPLRLSVRS